MNLKYIEKTPDIDQYWELFTETGWNEKYRFSKEELEESNSKSWYALSVYKDEELIGFGRIISDGIYHALIADLIVSAKYQNTGIGSKILKSLLDKCLSHNIRDIQLFAAKDKYNFYEKYNFKKRPDNAPGMQYEH